MAETKMAEAAKFWICAEGHLHVELRDADGHLLAAGALDPNETVNVVFDLVDQLDKVYDEDQSPADFVDTIGPTVGHA